MSFTFPLSPRTQPFTRSSSRKEEEEEAEVFGFTTFGSTLGGAGTRPRVSQYHKRNV